MIDDIDKKCFDFVVTESMKSEVRISLREISNVYELMLQNLNFGRTKPKHFFQLQNFENMSCLTSIYFFSTFFFLSFSTPACQLGYHNLLCDGSNVYSCNNRTQSYYSASGVCLQCIANNTCMNQNIKFERNAEIRCEGINACKDSIYTFISDWSPHHGDTGRSWNMKKKKKIKKKI